MSQPNEGGPAPGLVSAARENLGAAAEAIGRMGRILDLATAGSGQGRDMNGEDEGRE